MLIALLWASRRHFTVRSGPTRRPLQHRRDSRRPSSLASRTACWVSGCSILESSVSTSRFARPSGRRSCISPSPGTRVSFQHETRDMVPRFAVADDGVMVAYSTLIFRPVRYRLHTFPQERAATQAIVREHGRSSLDFFKPWPDKSYFFSASGRTFLAYRVGGGFALVLADPVGRKRKSSRPSSTSRNSVRRTTGGLRSTRRCQISFRLCPLRPRKAEARRRRDRRPPEVWTRRPKREGAPGRRAQSRATRRQRPLLRATTRRRVVASSRYLGRLAANLGRRERQFTLGRFDTEYVRRCPVLVATTSDGVMQAFVNVIPSHRRARRRST